MSSIGKDGYCRLVDALHGCELDIPVRKSALHEDHRLVKAVGRESAEKLVSLFSGERIYVPRDVVVTRDSEYIDAMRSGKSNFEISRQFGVTERNVRRIFSRLGIRNPNHRPRIVAPSTSNAALTGLTGIPVTFSGPAAENRASGL